MTTKHAKTSSSAASVPQLAELGQLDLSRAHVELIRTFLKKVLGSRMSYDKKGLWLCLEFGNTRMGFTIFIAEEDILRWGQKNFTVLRHATSACEKDMAQSLVDFVIADSYDVRIQSEQSTRNVS